jgi:hypothetical protein
VYFVSLYIILPTQYHVFYVFLLVVHVDTNTAATATAAASQGGPSFPLFGSRCCDLENCRRVGRSSSTTPTTTAAAATTGVTLFTARQQQQQHYHHNYISRGTPQQHNDDSYPARTCPCLDANGHSIHPHDRTTITANTPTHTTSSRITRRINDTFTSSLDDVGHERGSE